MAIRLILIDDEPIERLGIRARLDKHKDFEIIDEASSVDEALEKIRRLKPDAIFLDMEITDSSGLDVARMLDRHQHRPIIVFLAADRGYALQAFDVEAADYLLKPIDDERFEQTLERIRDSVSLHRAADAEGQPTSEATSQDVPVRSGLPGRIAVRHGKKTHLLEVIEIEWIKAAGDYIQLHVAGDIHLFREPLSVLLARLPPEMFYRIHRSVVVNLSKVSDFSTLRNHDLAITMKDGAVLRASRTFSGELRKALTQR